MGGDTAGGKVLRDESHSFVVGFRYDEARAWIPNPQAEGTHGASVLRWAERDADPHHACILAHTTRLLAIRNAHLSMPRERAQITCEPIDDRSLWLIQPSALGGWLVSIIDFDGSTRRELPLPSGADSQAIDVLSDTSPDASAHVRAADNRLIVEPGTCPYGLVLHVQKAVS